MVDLTGLPVLDLAIGLAFIYLLFSLLASAVQEQIAGLLALRAKTLEAGLRNMLEKDPDAPAGAPTRGLVDELYRHPLIRSLYKEGRVLLRPRNNDLWKKGRLPSYISPRSFALALIDTVAPAALSPARPGGAQSHNVLASVRADIDQAEIPAGVKRQLLLLVDDARGELDDFRKGLEAWFDDSMARVSGWYKRHAQLIMLVLATGITLGLNANTLTIGDRLWKDSAVRTAVVQQSAQATSETEGLDDAANAVDSVAKLGVPLGWSSDKSDPRHVDFANDFPKNALTIVLGWTLTVIAVSLGAPFWFDSLSRLARLRNTGKPETPLPASGRGQPNERVVT
jgi:hypothetical protein